MHKSFFFLSAAALIALSAGLFLWASLRWEARRSGHPPAFAPAHEMPVHSPSCPDSIQNYPTTILAAV